ncbi:MAG: zinc ABC transporter substrate-binding protein [Clostridia bacterium]|nr:zinc ABC transporter substrate-binding protein [Clostridia bacterium]
MRILIRAAAALLLVSIFLCIVSCSDTQSEDDAPLSVVTTIFPPYDIARNIAQGTDGVEITMLLPPGSESHDYEPSVSDIAAVGKADLVICVGGETDEWIDNILAVSQSKASVLRLTDMTELLEEDESVLVTKDASHHSHSHEHTHEHTHEHGEDCVFDEHVWTSPENAAKITETIAEEMCRLSGEDKDTFKTNAAAYAASLREVQREMNSLAKESDTEMLIFADRFPFRYLADSIGIDCRAAFSGCASDSEVTLEAVYRLMSLVRETEARAIFTCEFSSRNAANLIAEETGCRVLELHSCHNVSKEDFDSGVTCLTLMRRNLDCLKEVLLGN